MSKKPKLPQTDYSRGGRDISNTAVPAYQANIGRMETYLNDPQGQIDSYLNKYYDNTTAQSDFLKNMQRGLANTTANNYAATGGGYSSAGQQAYEDTQRAYNDLGARLYDAGVQSSANMANQYFNSLLNANSSYNEAYKNGQTYHETEQYNAMVDQVNKHPFWNTIGGFAQGAGNLLMTNPATMGIGMGLNVLGTGAQSVFGGGSLGAGAAQGQGVGASGGAYNNPWNVTFNNALGSIRNYANNTPTENVPAWMKTWATALKN